MDYPEAWAFVRNTQPSDHHSRCSWLTTSGALLCDCDVVWDEYVRRGGADPRGKTPTPWDSAEFERNAKAVRAALSEGDG